MDCYSALHMNPNLFNLSICSHVTQTTFYATLQQKAACNSNFVLQLTIREVGSRFAF